ncbi:MAG: LysM peptidoglycan-binding domain-containing protein [Planctomycetota bacterium]|nr:LysM peptidoglycan-binding domain-containing protein [Planctomycetota bacterium]
MSTGFRLFLLLILLFGAVWIHRHRARDIEYWLGSAVELRRGLAPRDESVGAVDRLLYPEVTLVLMGPEISSRPPRAPSRRSPWYPDLVAADPPDRAVEFPDDPAEMPEEAHYEPPAAGRGDDGGDAGRDISGEPPRPPAEEIHEVPPPVTTRLYTVKPGDNLSKISRRQLGKEQRYREILRLNDDVLHGSVDIFPGMKLRIPKR